MVCLQMDANAKLGPEIVKGDPHPRSDNGDLLWGVIKRNNLVVCNAADFCKGIITRRRRSIKGLEESIIDFLIISEDMFEHMVEMLVDEERIYSVAKYQKTRHGLKITEPDHHMLIGKFDFDINMMKKKDERKEVFMFNDPEGQKIFKTLTSNNTLSNCFSSPDLEVSAKKWFKEFNNVIHRSFKKIRIVGKNGMNKDINKLLKEKNEIVKKYDELKRTIEESTANKETYLSFFDHEDQLVAINEKIAVLTADKNAELISDHIKDLTCEEGGFSLPKMYELKKKIFPKDGDVPAAMKDMEGNVVSTKNSLVKLYRTVY